METHNNVYHESDAWFITKVLTFIKVSAFTHDKHKKFIKIVTFSNNLCIQLRFKLRAIAVTGNDPTDNNACSDKIRACACACVRVASLSL